MLYQKFDAQREWEKLSKEFIDIGRESRQQEVDAANKRADDEKLRAERAETEIIRLTKLLAEQH